MDNIIYTTVERILQFIEYKGVSKREFASRVGISHSLMGKTNSIGSDKLEKILSAYPELNPVWLLTGAGVMTNELDTKKMQGEFAGEMQGSEQKQGINPPPDDFLNNINVEAMNKEILIMEKLKKVNNASELYDYVGDFECNLFMCHNYASYYYYGTIYSDVNRFLMRQLSRVELLDRFKDNLDIVRELREVIIPYKDVLAQLYRDLEDFNESHDNLYSLDKIDPKEAKARAKSTKKPTSN